LTGFSKRIIEEISSQKLFEKIYLVRILKYEEAAEINSAL
jgi:hypothetical protein